MFESTLERRKKYGLVKSDNAESQPLTFECDIGADAECAKKMKVQSVQSNTELYNHVHVQLYA